MSRIAKGFFRRGLSACGLGPIVLAILYLIFQRNGGLESLTVNEVCVGIFSLSALGFIAGGMNVIYQIERLPLMVAILIHGCVLYASYLAAYLLNNWLAWSAMPIVVFTGIFLVGYIVIWVAIYSIMKRHTAKINETLKERQQSQ